jgi:hypothetical protein
MNFQFQTSKQYMQGTDGTEHSNKPTIPIPLKFKLKYIIHHSMSKASTGHTGLKYIIHHSIANI